MRPSWVAVDGSSRIIAEAYDEELGTIYVSSFPNGVEWWYGGCPPSIWEEFAAPGQSRGAYIRDVLDSSPTDAGVANGRDDPGRL